MSPDEQKRLGAFLKETQAAHAHAYLKLSKDASPESCQAALEKRRLWAQTQQTNPRYQDEAIWVLSNLDLLREALEKTDEELIWVQSASDTAFADPGAIGFYELLGLSPAASQDEIRDAHRLRYRDARHLKDRHEAHRLYAALDEAWRVLSDEALREEYDKKKAPKPRLATEDSKPQTERQILTEAPNLRLAGVSRLSVTVSGKPVLRQLEVQSVGPGLIDATTRCDQPWLTASPERLDPHLTKQTITIQIDPRQLAGKSALGQVVIQNFSGQRLSCHVRVQRQSGKRRVLFGALGVALIFGAIALFTPLGSFLRSPTVPDMQSGTLTLTIQPVAANIYVNNQEVGAGQNITLHELPIGQPFLLRAEAPGHEFYRETLLIGAGESLQKTVILERTNNR